MPVHAFLDNEYSSSICRRPPTTRTGQVVGGTFYDLRMKPFALAVMLGLCATTAMAQDSSWFDRVLAIKAEQPSWMTPLVTVTPRLEQEFRYDVVSRRDPNSMTFGFGKGIELIPAERLQVSMSVPPYVTHEASAAPNGFGDMSVLTKIRLWASPEAERNGIVTAFVGVTFPTGHVPNGSGTTVLTPTLAVGKGWGRLDVQSTAAINVPFNGAEKTVAWNTAVQWHVGQFLWPEVEANATWFSTSGHRQTFVTPGVIVGRFHLTKRVGLSFGGGVSLAASSYHTESRRWTFTVRFPFPL